MRIYAMQAAPSCAGPSITLTLSPFSCALDPAQNELVCLPAYLLVTSTPGMQYI